MDTFFRSRDHRQTAFDATCQISVDQQLAELSTLDLPDLRVCWRKLLRTQPPQLSRALLLRLLAYRLKARAFGDLDRATVRYLGRTARESARRKAQHGRQNAKAPPPVPTNTRLKPGTLLAREFNGSIHCVTVTQEGFAWQGSTYSNLSEIARLITGTRWNGPRFFGLRDKLERGQAGGENS